MTTYQSLKKWRQQNIEKVNKWNRHWNKSEKGKQYWNKRQAERKRKLNWFLMFPNPFDESIIVEYHHITDAYVVAIPKDLHRLYLGKYHRENTMEIVKQIYLKEN